MKRTVVVLEIHDDRDDRPWHEAAGLPDPASWNPDADWRRIRSGHGTPPFFPPDNDAYIEIVLERRVEA